MNIRLQMVLLAALAVLAYFPMRNIPLIADDYPNIEQSLTYGSPKALGTMLGDAQFRLRSTSYWTMDALWHIGGVSPAVYRAAMVLMHIVCTWILLAVGLEWHLFRPAAFWAAAFFAVQEGHQEAIVWVSAMTEPLLFAFGLAAIWCRLKGHDAIGWVLFAMALLSKESAVILLPLLLLTVPRGDWRRVWPRIVPYAILCLLAVGSVAQSRANSFRFNDGSFSLAAPFWITWPRSMFRLLWIWGWLALPFAWRARRNGVVAAIAWMGIALIPYSFLTYSTAIPSRQTYLASAGLAWLVGIGLVYLLARKRKAAVVVMAAIVVHNVGYLWTKKRAQFEERAAPTTALLEAARKTSRPLWMQCFPLPPIDAEAVMTLGAGRPASDLVWSKADAEPRGAVPFCYATSPPQSR